MEASPTIPPGQLTDVPGLRVGHWTDAAARTGCTVVLCDGPGAVGGVSVRGAAPGTRETDLLRPGALVQRVNAVLLTGGSAFGLDAAGGVMRYLAERGIGFATPTGPVPIVPGAVLYDLSVGRADARPSAEQGYLACQAAGTGGPIAEGPVGAGAGATVGKHRGPALAAPGGVGTAARRLADGTVVAALVAVNALGSIYDPATGALVAGPPFELGASGAAPRTAFGAQTTIGVVATSAPLGSAAANRLAALAQDALALTIRPAHTLYDGDTLFALATGTSAAAPEPVALGASAVAVVAEAILRAVRKRADAAPV